MCSSITAFNNFVKIIYFIATFTALVFTSIDESRPSTIILIADWVAWYFYRLEVIVNYQWARKEKENQESDSKEKQEDPNTRQQRINNMEQNE